MLNLNEAAREINEVNRSNGWKVLTPEVWADSNQRKRLYSIFALIHSEVSEALEDFRHDQPTHFGAELADVVIRVLDAVGGLDLNFSTGEQAAIDEVKTFVDSNVDEPLGKHISWNNEYDVPAALNVVHKSITAASTEYEMENKEGFLFFMLDVLGCCYAIAHDLKIDLDEEIARTIEANRHRGYKHGGKRI